MAEEQARGPKTLTITLTGRAPVRIVWADWPIIAEARDRDGQEGNEPNRTRRMTVRRHVNGRAVVYAVYTTNWPDEHDARGGQTVAAGEDVPAAIRSVGADLADATGDPETWVRLAQECCADLPAETL